MMYLEFNWTANVYQPRFGDTFTDVRGVRSWESLEAAKSALEQANLTLGKRTGTHTWEIVSKPIFKSPQEAMRYHVSGAIERGEGEAIEEIPAAPLQAHSEPVRMWECRIKGKWLCAIRPATPSEHPRQFFLRELSNLSGWSAQERECIKRGTLSVEYTDGSRYYHPKTKKGLTWAKGAIDCKPYDFYPDNGYRDFTLGKAKQS